MKTIRRIFSDAVDVTAEIFELAKPMVIFVGVFVVVLAPFLALAHCLR